MNMANFEGGQAMKHKNVMFVKLREADCTLTTFYDPDIDDSDMDILWVCQT